MNTTSDYSKFTISDIKAKQYGKNDSIYPRYFTRHISIHITKLLLNTNITPNQVTVASFILCLFSIFLFSLGNYYSNILGALFINISLVVDAVDGEIARCKNLCSKTGYWLDVIADRIGNIGLVVGIFIGQYPFLLEKNIVLLGIVAILNVTIISSLIFIQFRFPSLHSQAVKVKGGHYIGFAEIILFITICALLDKLTLLLSILAIVLPFVWIKTVYKMISSYKSDRNSKK